MVAPRPVQRGELAAGDPRPDHPAPQLRGRFPARPAAGRPARGGAPAAGERGDRVRAAPTWGVRRVSSDSTTPEGGPMNLFGGLALFPLAFFR